MNKTKRHSKVSYMLVSLALLLSLTIMAIPMAGPAEAAESATYNATEIQDWLISQINSTNITFTAPTVSLDDTANTMTVNGNVTARGVTAGLSNGEFTFDGTRNVSISGELSASWLVVRPIFSCNVTVKCQVAENKTPQVVNISDITVAGFTPSLSPGDLNEIANTMNKAINASGFKLDSLGGDLTGIDVSAGPKLNLTWSGDSVELNETDIESELNNATTALVSKANDYLSTGYSDGWSLNVSIGGGKVSFNATATALNSTAKIEHMNVTFADTTASINNASVSVWNKSATFFGTAKIACTSYTPSLTVTSIGVGDENPGLRDWVALINSALRDALKRLVNNIVDDTGLRCRISRFNHIAVTDGQLKVWWYAPPSPPGPGPGPARYYLDTDVCDIEGSYRISDTGKMLETIKVTTEDGILTISIPKGTICLDKSDERLEVLTIAVDESPPSPPDNGHIIGAAYDCSPDGANFAPPINITFRYNEDELPAGAVEGDLEAYFWNITAWEAVPSTADPVGNKVTATVSNFGDCSFAVMWIAPPPPPNFTLADLSISPARVSPGENVTISVLVTNVGEAEGTYQAQLKVDDVVIATKSITLVPGESTTVTFTIAEEEPGTYAVKIGTLEGSFVVEKVVPVSWISRYWWVILEILVVIGLLLFFFRWWRPRKAVGS